jgi:ABC-type amino acid transport substrate-binding protein
MRKDSADLAGAINGALAAMREGGTLRTISERWFGSDVTQ